MGETLIDLLRKIINGEELDEHELRTLEIMSQTFDTHSLWTIHDLQMQLKLGEQFKLWKEMKNSTKSHG